MLRGQGSKEARITRIALDKALNTAPRAIAEWIATHGQEDFESDHTELIGDLAHEMQTYCIDGGYEIDLDGCITLVSEDMPYGAGYDLFNRSYNRTDRYIRFLDSSIPRCAECGNGIHTVKGKKSIATATHCAICVKFIARLESRGI